MKKQKAPKKSSSSKYKKRQKKELGKRATKDQKRRMAEFAQRIQEEPSLTTLLDGKRNDGETG